MYTYKCVYVYTKGNELLCQCVSVYSMILYPLFSHVITLIITIIMFEGNKIYIKILKKYAIGNFISVFELRHTMIEHERAK